MVCCCPLPLTTSQARRRAQLIGSKGGVHTTTAQAAVTIALHRIVMQPMLHGRARAGAAQMLCR